MSDAISKTKTLVYINKEEDYALVHRFYTEDGLLNGTAYSEFFLEEGDRAPEDYADFDFAPEDECDPS